MGGRCEGKCQEAGGEELEECCKEQEQLAEASKEGLGSEWAVVPMMLMMSPSSHTVFILSLILLKHHVSAVI
jgi:hypothetical protein